MEKNIPRILDYKPAVIQEEARHPVKIKEVPKERMTIKDIQRDLYSLYFNLDNSELSGKVAIANTIGKLAEIEANTKASIRNRSLEKYDVFGIYAERRGRKKK